MNFQEFSFDRNSGAMLEILFLEIGSTHLHRGMNFQKDFPKKLQSYFLRLQEATAELEMRVAPG